MAANSTEKQSGPANPFSLWNNQKFVTIVAIILVVPSLLNGLVRYFMPYPALVTLTDNLWFAWGVGVGAFLLLAPFVAERLEWKPGQPVARLLPFFLNIENGRAMCIEDWGGKAKRYLMTQSDAEFRGPSSKVDESWSGQWNVVTSASAQGVHARNVWELYVESITGFAFGGWALLRRPREYQIDIPTVVTIEDGEILTVVTKKSVTNHVRVREFSWSVLVGFFTKDRYYAQVVLSFRMACVNPHKLLFWVDRWDVSFAKAVRDRVVQTGKQYTVDQLLGDFSKGVASREFLVEEVFKLNEDLPSTVYPKDSGMPDVWGLKLSQVQLVGFGMIGRTEAEVRALTAAAVAAKLAQAERHRASGEADGQAEIIKKRRKQMDTPQGVVASTHEAFEVAARDAGASGGVVNLPPASADDALKILAALSQKTGGKNE